MITTHECPTCRKGVNATRIQTIPRHLDTALIDVCPSSGEPFYTTVEVPPNIHGERTTLTFPERYGELRYDMGLPIWQVAKKLGHSPASLYRMLLRYEMTVPSELVAFVTADGKKVS